MTSDEKELFAQLAGVFDGVDESKVVNVTALSTTELHDKLFDLTEELKQRSEVLWPKTRKARDMHSLRNSIQIELRERNML